jgi:threonine/homoserine/homoserine lactone efflux protein
VPEPVVAAALGLGLGLSLAGPPGPVNALIARESVRGGAWAGVRAGYPAPLLDTVALLVVLVGLPRVVDLARWSAPLAAVGALLLLYLAIDIARVRPAPKPVAPGAVWAVTLSNPFFYAWWPSVGASFAAAVGPWGVAGFLLAIYGWVAGFSFLMAHGATRWPWFAPAVGLLSADGLLAFAVLLALRAAPGL